MGQLTDEAIKNIDWQWGANFDSCANAVISATRGDYAAALDSLKSGQRHNSHVQQIYQDVNDSIGTGPLWDLVATASLYPGGGDLVKAKPLLEDEFRRHADTLGQARDSWHAGQWWLASAQVQAGVKDLGDPSGEYMRLYRACIRDQRLAFFAIIDTILS